MNAFFRNPNIILHKYPKVVHAFARKGGTNFDENAATLADQQTANFFKVNLA